MVSTGFNKAKFGNSEASWTRLKIPMPKSSDEVTRLVVRILPPYGNLAAQRRWSLYFSVHYGFEGRDSRDPTKTRHKPFACIEQKRNGMIVSDCPMCNLMQSRKKSLENKIAKLKADGYTDDEAKALTKDMSEWLRKYNVDRKHYMSVMDESGRFHVLMISHDTKKRLEGVINRLREQGIDDPLDLDSGVWFEFRRSGNPKVVSSLVDEVDVVMEKTVVNGRSYMTPKPAPLSEDQISEALRILPSLDTVVTSISRDQIEQLVNCSGDPEEVDAIFNSGRPDAPAPEKRAPAQPKPTPAQPKSEPAPVQPKPTPVVAAEADDEDDEIARMEAMIAAKKAAKAAAAVKAVKETVVAPKPAPPQAQEPAFAEDADLDAMSAEDFLRQYPDPSAG
jgi:hypothetical protein